MRLGQEITLVVCLAMGVKKGVFFVLELSPRLVEGGLAVVALVKIKPCKIVSTYS